MDPNLLFPPIWVEIFGLGHWFTHSQCIFTPLYITMRIAGEDDLRICSPRVHTWMVNLYRQALVSHCDESQCEGSSIECRLTPHSLSFRPRMPHVNLMQTSDQEKSTLPGSPSVSYRQVTDQPWSVL